MGSKASWRQIYPWISTVVANCDSASLLLRQTLECLAATYDAEGILVAGLEAGDLNTLQAYATAGASAEVADLDASALQEGWQDSGEDEICCYQLRSPPNWLLNQRRSPERLQLSTGELVLPVVSQSLPPSPTQGRLPRKTLQLVLKLSRSPLSPPIHDAASSSPLASVPSKISTSLIQGWNEDELESLDIVCSQLGLAYSALYWRDRLEQSRLQVALVGRIAQLLNSNLNPDEMVGRIVAELGQGLLCDRCIVMDLRHDPVSILAMWHHPHSQPNSFSPQPLDRLIWQDAVEMFLQGGASYLQIERTDDQPELIQEWLEEIQAVSVLIIPLFIQAEFFGAVALLSHTDRRVYQLDELQTIRQVADQVAIALTNAQHYQSLWYKQETLRIQKTSVPSEVHKDELTQLMNRRLLERELDQLSTKAVWAVHPFFSVIICDIDYFKLVNDTHGHRVGDEVLQVLAQRLQRQLRRDTPVYRYGGEEFIVLLAETELKKAVDVAERLCYFVHCEPIPTSAGAIDITASFGVAQQNPDQDQQAWDVVHRAEQALHEAKRQGRDRVKAF